MNFTNLEKTCGFGGYKYFCFTIKKEPWECRVLEVKEIGRECFFQENIMDADHEVFGACGPHQRL